MKKAAICAALITLAVASGSQAGDAFGSVFGTLATGKSIGDGEGEFQIGVGAADRTSVFGTFVFGLSEFTEARVKLGLADDEGVDTKVAFGADFKYQLMDVGAGLNDPFDMGLGGMFEYTDLGHFSVWQLGARTVGSYPFELRNGTTLSPYGSLNVRLEGYSSDDYYVVVHDEPVLRGGDSETELKFGLGFGVSWQFNRNVALFGEFQFDGNDGLFFGLNFGVM
jgi:hypothetical protein